MIQQVVRTAVPNGSIGEGLRTFRSGIEAAFYTAEMASKGLTECWRDAMAAKPADWKLMGVACGPPEADRKVRSADEWCAWARGPNKERLEGRGSGPGNALLALTGKLKELSP